MSEQTRSALWFAAFLAVIVFVMAVTARQIEGAAKVPYIVKAER